MCAGRGCGKQLHRAALTLEILVNVAPGDAANVPVRIQDAPEVFCIGEADAVEPAASHQHRMMMQTHQRMRVGVAEGRIEPLQFLVGQSSADLAFLIVGKIGRLFN